MIQQQRQKLDEHWQQRLTRSKYEVEQARRQYASVEPEHRLVARELERRWEESLRCDEQLRAEYDRFVREQPIELSASEREEITALSLDLPSLWHAESTTNEDRQAIARLLLEKIVVNIEGETDRVNVDISWSGGFQSCHTLYRPVQTYKQLSRYDELIQRLETLRVEGRTLGEMATIINGEGFHPPKRAAQFNKAMLSRFFRERGTRLGPLPKSVTDESHLETNEWWLADLAAELKMPIATLHRWQRVGWLTSRKVSQAGGRWAIHANAVELTRLRQLRAAPRGWPDVYPKELTTPTRRTDNPK